MKKRVFAVLGAILLSLTLMGAKSGASITASDAEFHFAQVVPTFDLIIQWAPKNGKQPDGYWAKTDCFANVSTVTGYNKGIGELVYRQFQSVDSTTQQGGWQFGPTPSWLGGGANCTLELASINNGVFNYIASDTFEVLP